MTSIFVRAFKDALFVFVLSYLVYVILFFVAWALFPAVREMDVLTTLTGAAIGLLVMSFFRFIVSVVTNTMLSSKLADKTNIEFAETAILVAKYYYVTKGEEVDNLNVSKFYLDYQTYKQRELI